MNPPTHQQQRFPSLPQHHSTADEATQIRLEKEFVNQLLRIHFSTARIVLDPDPPTIGHCPPSDPSATLTFLPPANVSLHRIERADVAPGGPQGSIHSLHLYVHAGPPYTAATLINTMTVLMRKTDEEGGFVVKGSAWAVLSWGIKIMFFRYGGGRLVGLSVEDVKRDSAGVGVAASMDGGD